MANRVGMMRSKPTGYPQTTGMEGGPATRNSDSPSDQHLMSQQQQYSQSPQRQQQAWQEQQQQAQTRQPSSVSAPLSSELMSQAPQTPRPYSGMPQNMMSGGQVCHASS